MIELRVTSTSAVSEPRTATAAATAFARFPNGAAFRTYGTNSRRRRDCWRFNEDVGKMKQRKMVEKPLPSLSDNVSTTFP